MTETFDPVANATFVQEADDPITPSPSDMINDPEAQEEAARFANLFGGKRDKAEKPKRERKPKAPKPVPPKPRPGQLKKPLMEMYGSIGMTVSMFDPQCGTTVMMNAEKCAEAMEALARDNPAVRRVVMQLITTSVWGQVVAAHMPIIYAIAMHHVPALANSPMGKMQSAAFEAMQEQQQKAEQEEMDYYRNMSTAEDAA